MREVVVALMFTLFLLSPSVVACFCASERRLLRRKANSCCPKVDRRDSR
jgi:hypothetical protein